MRKFTYELPFSTADLMNKIRAFLQKNGQDRLCVLLDKASLQIEERGYSHYTGEGRWDAHSAYVIFYVQEDHLSELDNTTNKDLLSKITGNLIPAEVGFDVKDASFKLASSKQLQASLIPDTDVDVDTDIVTRNVIDDTLPYDIKIKGFHMVQIHAHYYALENYLRLFIQKVCRDRYGDNFFLQLKLPRGIDTMVTRRQVQAFNPIRNEEIFYLNLEELSEIIFANWPVFERFFPSQDFLKSKLEDLIETQVLLQQNSYINDTKRSMVKTYYKLILKQLSGDLKESGGE